MAGGMRAAIQEFLGEKFFRNKVNFDEDVVLKRTASLYSPVPSEPSIGTPHPTSYINRSNALMLNDSANTADVWSSAQTMAGVPVGAKAAWCMCRCYKAAATPRCSFEAASGITLSAVTGTGFMRYVNTGLAENNGVGVWRYLRIHLDSNRQYKYCTDTSSSTVEICNPIDYEM
jgi:hypothetical protein